MQILVIELDGGSLLKCSKVNREDAFVIKPSISSTEELVVQVGVDGCGDLMADKQKQASIR